MSKEDLQKKYIELQLVEQQIQQIQQQLLILEDQLMNLERTKDNIDDIKSVKEGSDVYVPVGAGVFAAGQIKDTKHLLVGIGSNVAVKKTLDESRAIVEKQIKEVDSLMKQMEEIMNKVSLQARSLQEEVQELAGKEHNN